MPDNPNPQGKGLVPVLQSIGQEVPRGIIPPKQIDQVEMELFTSLFVLQSQFKFHPVVGRSYWLYQVEGEYRLLMVGPDEWPNGYRGRYIAECMLQDDRTWTVALDPAMENDTEFMARLDQQRRQFEEGMASAESLEDVLPVYEEHLGFYGKIMAFSLGKSLGMSMQLTGINTLSYDEAKGLLSHHRAQDDGEA